jgi:chromosome segregation ATPase
MEISDSDYQELVAAKSERDTLKARVPELEEKAKEADKVAGLEKQVETLETAKVAAETERDKFKGEKETLEEDARKDELAKERLGKFGKDFLGKLGEITKTRVKEQAASLSDDDWVKRVEELEETAGVKHDAGGAPEPGEGEVTHTREETARARLGSTERETTEPTTAQRGSVVGGLVKTLVKS